MNHSAVGTDPSLRTCGKSLLWFLGVLWRAAPASLAVYIGAIVVSSLVPAIQLLVITELIDQVNLGFGDREGGFKSMLVWVGILAAVQMAHPGLRAVTMHSRAIVREKLEWQIEDQVLERAGSVALEQYENPAFFDRLERALVASHSRAFLLFDAAGGALERAITMISLLGLLLSAHFSLPLVLLAGATPLLVSYLRRGKETFELYHTQTPEQRHANYLVELLIDREAAKEIRLYNLGDYLTTLWTDLADKLKGERIELIVQQQKTLAMTRLSALLAFFVALFILLWQAVSAVITLGAFFALIEAARTAQDHLRAFLQSASGIFGWMLHLMDMQDFATTPLERRDDMVELPEGPLSIVCQNVSFAYPEGPLILQDITFQLAAGEKLALVGENGAGKTTLIKLLLGLYTPTVGTILVNGIDIRDIDPTTLRRHCAVVFQDFLQFQLPVQENIGFGQVEELENMSRIQRAASASGATSMIQQLPAQYRTLLGRYFEGGRDLSRGEWQKLALARSYFRDAMFLVFDEPTAALDPRAELEVFKQFHALSSDKTAVFVSHRMSSARIADRILVLKAGRLLESGHHDALMAANGEYARMFSMQAQWYREGG